MPPRQDALNQSFLLTDAEAQGSAERLGVAPGELSCLDTAAVVSTYCELLRMGNADVLHAVMNATEGLLCKLQVSQQTQPNFIAAGPAVRQLAIDREARNNQKPSRKNRSRSGGTSRRIF